MNRILARMRKKSESETSKVIDEIYNIEVKLTCKSGREFYSDYHNFDSALEEVKKDVERLNGGSDEVVKVVIEVDNI